MKILAELDICAELKQNLIKKTAEFSENLAELDAISAEFEFK
jgi:hypothetical protein